MPVLEKITISDFRNIGFQELEFSPNVNCISGNNGEGKTNLLDAIYYLSMTKSAFSTSDRFNFRFGTDSFSICGNCRMPNGLETKFSIGVQASGEKRVKKDGKACKRVAEHIGTLPVVMVSPSDTALVSESGEERRKFINSVLSQMEPEYLAAAQQYGRRIVHRNRMLKNREVDRDLLAVLDSGLAADAEKIYQARKAFTEELKPAVAGFYGEISGGTETVDIEYRSDLSKGPLDLTLGSCLEKDLVLGYTTAGVHRDDFIFTINGHPIRKCGSQGQQKSFLVALKFAQYEIMKRNYGYAPTLLLDDVFDKLDLKRISNLIAMVSGNDFGQIFITDSNKVRLEGIVDGFTDDRVYYECEGGKFTRI